MRLTRGKLAIFLLDIAKRLCERCRAGDVIMEHGGRMTNEELAAVFAGEREKYMHTAELRQELVDQCWKYGVCIEWQLDPDGWVLLIRPTRARHDAKV